MSDFETLLEAFQSHLKKRDRSPHSIRAYLADLRHFAAWFEQHNEEPFTLAAVLDSDVRDWRDEVSNRSAAATVNRKLASLAAFFAWAEEKGLAHDDPTRHVQRIEQQPVKPKALPETAVRRILRRARDSCNLRDHALLQLLAATGLRAAEAAALHRGDLEIGPRSGWVTVRAGKGRKKRRVPVHEQAREPLNEYLKERKFFDPAGRESEPLFTTRMGAAMTPYAIWYTVKKYAALAGVEGVSPHSFRHTVATRLVRNPKVDMVTAAAFLGHARLDTTARYAQPNEDDLERAAEEMMKQEEKVSSKSSRSK